MKLKGSEAKKIILEEHDDWKFVNEKMVGQRRWVTEWSSINEHLPSGKFYEFCYDAPSTESSGGLNDTLWANDDDVDVIEVHKVETVISVWEAVDEPN
ncbi:MAG: DUF1647 domain-containing protein [Spirochaetes bacterium]|nr:DUF1647 domain-containing protein [Spirochaetota bacterium]